MNPRPTGGRRLIEPGPRALAAMVFWLITAPGAAASMITLLTRAACSAAAQQATCWVEIENEGDESAMDLELAAAVADRPDLRRALGALQPGERVAAEIVLPLTAASGRLPVILTLRYLDEHGYPLSAISHAWVDTGPGDSLPVAALVEAATLAGPGRVSWRLTNEGSTPLAVTATLLVPDGLELDAPQRRVEVDPGQTVRGFHSVAAGTALPGSRYRVYLLLAQEDARASRSLLVPSTVTVEAARHAAVIYRRPSLVGLVAAAAAACSLQALLALRLGRRRSLRSLR